MSRRDFVELMALAGLLVGCRPMRQMVPATATPAAKYTIRKYPDGKSRVVRVHHAGSLGSDDTTVVPEVVDQMLDASITKLTGLDDPRAAWKALFSPKERVAIKVNTIRNGLFWTHPPLVLAVTERLVAAGVPPEQIVIYDRESDELKGAGYVINKDGTGVRCYGTDLKYTEGWKVAGRDVRLSNILLSCDALINMPILKSHSLSGFTFALKNHYGTFDRPSAFHDIFDMVRAIAELNALPPIKDRTRLIIGDALTVCLKEAASFPYWREAVRGEMIFVSFDPVALDAIASQSWGKLVADHGGNPESATSLANAWLKIAGELNVGTNKPDDMELVEVDLG